MTARVLVVDDILANVKLLQAKLTAEYFEVITAMNGAEALEVAQRAMPDIVLLDVMMPGMDGFEVCRRLKANPATLHIPVIMVTALDQPSDRINGLEAGADDFLTKPVNDTALFARVKSLVRLKMLTDELRSRASTSERMGLIEDEIKLDALSSISGEILLVDDRTGSVERIKDALGDVHSVKVATDPQAALFVAAEQEWDLILVSLSLKEFDGLRLCSQLRSLDRTRNIPILIIVEPEDSGRMLRGLDIGMNDYIARPIDKNELKARVRTQLRQHRYAEQLRANVTQSMEMAITDALTGLYNRRYMESHLDTLVTTSAQRGKSISLLLMDIDFFKAVNDTHGHDVGDDVLRELARRIRRAIRGIDMTCRLGGEEFVIVLPDADMVRACAIAERVREMVGREPFPVSSTGLTLDITISVGVAVLESAADTADTILKRADRALYQAKRDGRNRVVADAA